MLTHQITSGPSVKTKSEILEIVRQHLDRSELSIVGEIHEGRIDLGEGNILPAGRSLILHLDGGCSGVKVDASASKGESCCGG